MELRHLRYFVAVANERNFTRAAERLNIAQPPLSRQVRQLEEELGVDLFDREARPIRLTEAGRLLYEQAVQVLAGVDRIREVLRDQAGKGRKRFVIGFVGSTLYGLLPEVIRRFRECAARSDVSVIELSTIEQIAALKDGRIDAGFGRLRFEDAAIRRIVLAEEPLVAVMPIDHPLAGGGPVHLEALLGEPLIVYPRPARPSYADQVLGIFHDLGLQPRIVREVREVQTAIGLVAAHVGFSIVPASVQRMKRDDVAYVPIVDSPAHSPIMMIHRAGDVSPELGQLVAISEALYAGHGQASIDR
ncbi:LysR family transcriptional regulator [Sphingosinicella xenopeptidilytica]|uniref:LysR family transcriptional regulator n=1 Tax=Sphingosinicella xenopeptidilytica TaxID=364098 RepID=A0ABW3C067_SPHXN|nr:LysR family transcriptional regulator [Sphingosinicella sp.]